MSVITERRKKNIKILQTIVKNELVTLRKKSLYKNLNLSFYHRTKQYYHLVTLLNKKFMTMIRLQCLVTN